MNTITLLHQDDDLVIVSKPAGMLVHRDARSRTFEPLLLNTVRDQVGTYLHPIHRLDRNTSGLVVFATSSDAARGMQAAMARPDTIKAYLTLVRGTPPATFESTRSLRNDAGEPQVCRTDFEVIRQFDRCALVTARLSSGRHHQIRRHLNHLGHHVIGDTTHGKGRDNQWYRDHMGLPRMFLHAYRLRFVHPATNERMDVADPLPDDLDAVLHALMRG